MRPTVRVRTLNWLLQHSAYGRVPQTPDRLAWSRRELRSAGPTALLVGRQVPGVLVEDRTVPGEAGPVPVRVYRPPASGSAAGPAARPLVINFHGGGWVIGNHRSGAWLCSGLAAGLGAVVVSVGYRMAPEHRAPAAALDCFAVTRRLVEDAAAWGIDPARVAVMGDSAGGNLAAVVALMARDAGGPALAAQALIYPGTDATLASPSVTRLADAPVLNRQDILDFLAHYLGPDGDPTDPRVSPLLATDHTGLPPALIQTAEHDPLLDDGIRYARALRAAGVGVRYTCYRGAPHGFITIPGLDRTADQARAEIADHLADAFALPWPIEIP
jgi:acetyl esterase